MMNDFWDKVRGILKEKRKEKRWMNVVTVMMAAVVFITTYVLILPALTLEKDTNRVLACPYSVHSHTQECYDEEGNLICNQADFVVHTHDSLCYDEDGTLVCVLPEIKAHTHTQDCYTGERMLTCGQEESADHTHTDSCYTYLPTCGETEVILHTHSELEGCYDEDGNLICDKTVITEHQHEDGCFITLQDDTATSGDATTEDTTSEPAAVSEDEASEPAAISEEDLDADTVEDPELLYAIYEIEDISLDESKTTPSITSRKRMYYRFTPEYTHSYILSWSSNNTARKVRVYLYDSSGSSLDSTSAYTASQKTYTLEQGKTYYFGIGASTTSTTTATVTLSLCDHIFSDGVCVCGQTLEDLRGTCGADDNGENLRWSLSQDGVLLISGSGAMAEYSNASKTPWYVYKDYFSTLELSADVTGIKNKVFSSNLNTIIWHIKDASSIDDNIFASCSNINEIQLMDGSEISGDMLAQIPNFSNKGTLVLPKNGVIRFTGSSFETGDYTLSAGTWYCDENGVVYQLMEDETAALVYCPPTLELEDYGQLLGTLEISSENESLSGNYTVTTIEENAFSGCTGLTQIEIPEHVTAIADNAFCKCTGLQSIVWNVKDTAQISDNAFSDCTNITRISLGADAAISGEMLTNIDAAGKKSLELSLPESERVHITKNAYQWGMISLSEGTYYNANDVLYQLKNDGTATLVSCPAALQMDDFGNLLDPIEISNQSYQVTEIGSYAFYGCNNLTQITIPDTVFVSNFAFANCTNLSKVNDAETLQAVMSALSGHVQNMSAFVNTALWNAQDNDVLVNTQTIERWDNSAHYSLTLTMKDAGQTLLTGQNTSLELALSVMDYDIIDTLRLYIQLEPGNAIETDTTLFGYALDQTITFGSGNKEVDGTFHATDIPHCYYLELYSMDAGDSVTLTLNGGYPNWTSGGGSLLAWLDNSSGKDAPQQVSWTQWSTQQDSWKLSVSTGEDPTFQGDESVEGMVTVSGLRYNIGASGTVQSSYGKDPVSNITFFDTLTLPDGFYWRDGILDAIRSGNWYVQNIVNGKEVHIKLWENGTWKDVALAGWTSADNNQYEYGDVGVSVSSDGQIQIAWELQNPVSDADMFDPQWKMTFGSEVIVADTERLQTLFDEASAAAESASSASVTSGFINTVTAIENYTYGEKQESTDYACKDVLIQQGNFTLTKTSLRDSLSMGQDNTFTLLVTNTSVLPCSNLKELKDTLPAEYYIRPKDLDTMFSDKDHGKDLTVTIDQMYVYDHMTTQQITRADDSTTQIQTPSSETSENSVSMQIAWSEEESCLILTMTYQTGESVTYQIGENADYKTIEALFNELHATPKKTTRYTCTWSLKNVSLNSTQTVSYQVLTTVKDTFMYLTTDTRQSCIGDGSSISAENRAVAIDTNNTEKTAVKSQKIYRDFSVTKSGTFLGKAMGQSTNIPPDSVVTYTDTVNKDEGSLTYDALPLNDNLSGAQLLLVPVDLNTALEDQDLETMVVGEQTFYILNKEGTYRNIRINDTTLVDTVTVTQNDEGMHTSMLMYQSWTCDSGSKTLSYQVLVDPGKAHVSSTGTDYIIDTIVYLNDIEKDRLYDTLGAWGTMLSIDKVIVTNAEETIDDTHDYNQDQLAQTSLVHVGEAVTYRLKIASVSGTQISLTGSDMYDALPVSLNNYWSKDNVSVSYVTGEGSTCSISKKGADGWYIKNEETNAQRTSQKLEWTDDFKIKLKGVLYIYVTLNYPSNAGSTDLWTPYVQMAGDEELENTWHVSQLEASVSHTLVIQAEGMLQKGVYATGTAPLADLNKSKVTYSINQDTNGRLYYINDTSSSAGIVTYYIVIYNSGITRMYLSDIQDVLPTGFTFYSLYNNYGSSASSFPLDAYVCDRSIGKTEANNALYYNKLVKVNGTSNVTYKKASIKVTDISKQNQRVTICFEKPTSTRNDYLSYDNDRNQCYLSQNEAVVIAYSCRTNGYDVNISDETNYAAMQYDDYTSGGISLSQESFRSAQHTDLERNDGAAALLTKTQAQALQLDTSDTNDATLWLSSDTTVHRGEVVPGIQVESGATSVNVSAVIPWTIRAYNTGTDNLLDYTITDVMESPYQFTGQVTYQLQDSGGNNLTDEITLFSFPDDKGEYKRTNQDEKVTISYQDSDGTTREAVLQVGQGEIEIDNATFGKFFVSLMRDSDGNERLSVCFSDSEKATIVYGGSGVLKVSTENYTTTYVNKTFNNSAYITPNSQIFDSSQVSRGVYSQIQLTQDEADLDSVKSQGMVNVSFGYGSTSTKTVTELNPDDLSVLTVKSNDNIDVANTASSDDTSNFIILSNGKNSMFRYHLTMNNTGGYDNSTKNVNLYILADTLPEVNDHTIFDLNNSRGSEFQVDFASIDKLKPEVTVTTEAGVITTLKPSEYTLQFSETTDLTDKGSKTEADPVWSDSSVNSNVSPLTVADGWYTLAELQENGKSLQDMRSVRVVVSDPNSEKNLMPANCTITVSFNAVVDANSDMGYSKTAWNSFAYRYWVGTTELTASPLEVGVRSPGIPQLGKSLTDEYGEDYVATKDETFSFLIYKGKEQSFLNSEGQTVSDAEKIKQLEDAQIPYTIAQITVPEGKSESDMIFLDQEHLTTWDSMPDMNWKWENGQNYTITELTGDNSSLFTISSIRGRNNSYTFAYSNTGSIKINAVNKLKSWDFTLHKTNQTEDKNLKDAVFALYSSKQPATQVTVPDDASYTVQQELTLTENGEDTTWYLVDICTTDEDGLIAWKYLKEPKYYLKEIQAPNGYAASGDGGQWIFAPDTGCGFVAVTVTNDVAYELPKTGGFGLLWIYLPAAGFLVLGALYLRRNKHLL